MTGITGAAYSGLGVIQGVEGFDGFNGWETNNDIVDDSGSSWTDVFQGALGTGLNILQGRFGTPQGQYVRYGPDGRPQVVYNAPAGSTTPIFSATDLGASASLKAAGISTGTLLLVGGAVLAVVLVMSMNRR